MVGTVSSAAMVTSVGTSPWVGVRPRPVRLVERLVADQPLVVDRVLVDEDERHRHAARDGQLGRSKPE